MNIISNISGLILPLILFIVALILLRNKTKLFDSFISGAKEGMETAANLVPTLVLIMVGVNMLFASGAVDIIVSVLKPVLSLLGVPSQMLPGIVLRPFSGSATTAIADKLFRDFGADSDVAKMSSVLMGATDTIIYTIAVYFSAVKIKKTRHTLASSFIVFIFSIFVSIIVSKVFGL